jgi:hypothetical protein
MPMIDAGQLQQMARALENNKRWPVAVYRRLRAKLGLPRPPVTMGEDGEPTRVSYGRGRVENLNATDDREETLDWYWFCAGVAAAEMAAEGGAGLLARDGATVDEIVENLGNAAHGDADAYGALVWPARRAR